MSQYFLLSACPLVFQAPEESNFTSIQERIREHQGNPIVYQLPEEEQADDPLKGIKQAKLLPFAGAPHIDNDSH